MDVTYDSDQYEWGGMLLSDLTDGDVFSIFDPDAEEAQNRIRGPYLFTNTGGLFDPDETLLYVHLPSGNLNSIFWEEADKVKVFLPDYTFSVENITDMSMPECDDEEFYEDSDYGYHTDED